MTSTGDRMKIKRSLIIELACKLQQKLESLILENPEWLGGWCWESKRVLCAMKVTDDDRKVLRLILDDQDHPVYAIPSTNPELTDKQMYDVCQYMFGDHQYGRLRISFARRHIEYIRSSADSDQFCLANGDIVDIEA